ncbi:hypothetical protein OUZ56_012987 [Daphnia magna]|uniref:Uncharacterized protein n=1 Tax=Daphnia magna TaxID=35525 RepID=A0ABQ9Z4P5_9CRUS|nr:hypothetical protein OUZ56_012987 [Daphnia magna]
MARIVYWTNDPASLQSQSEIPSGVQDNRCFSIPRGDRSNFANRFLSLGKIQKRRVGAPTENEAHQRRRSCPLVAAV